MDSSKAFFTALGLSGTGKTSFIVGMYNELAAGKDGFHLHSEDDKSSMLEKRGNVLYNEKGNERFPTGTNSTEKITYTFSLYYNYDSILTFDWIDYAGGILQQREINFNVYKWLEDSIIKSTGIYVFIDGDCLCYEKREDRVENLKRNSARIISEYITKFCNSHNGSIPPIIFVITKMDRWGKFFESNTTDPSEEIKEAFNTVFCENSKITSYIVPVSLGKDIEVDNYSGKVEPIYIELPILIGTFYEFSSRYQAWSKELERDESYNKEHIKSLTDELSQNYKKLNNFWHKIPFIKIFFRNATEKRVSSLQAEISQRQHSVEEKRKAVEKNEKLLDDIGKVLNDKKDAFDFFEQGVFKKFTYGNEEIK